MSFLKSINTFTIEPSQYATEVAAKGQNATFGESISARLLFVAQLVMSIIALPIILAIGLIAALVQSCNGNGKEGFNELGDFLKQHLLILIPTSAVGIFAPLEATNSCFNSQKKCFARSELPAGAGAISNKVSDMTVDLGLQNPTTT
jgi:hypothetical protein